MQAVTSCRAQGSIRRGPAPTGPGAASAGPAHLPQPAAQARTLAPRPFQEPPLSRVQTWAGLAGGSDSSTPAVHTDHRGAWGSWPGFQLLQGRTALWAQLTTLDGDPWANTRGGTRGTPPPGCFWKAVPRAAGQGSPPRGGTQQSSELGTAWGMPAEATACWTAASGLGEVGRGARRGEEPGWLLSDGGAALVGPGGLQLQARRPPPGPDGQEGGQVEVQHGHPSAGHGRALAALRAGDPALLGGRRGQLPHTCLAEGVAAVEPAGQVPGEVIGRVADDTVAVLGPSSHGLFRGWGLLWQQHPGEGCGGAVQPLQVSPRFGLSTGNAPPAPEDRSPGLCRPGRWAVAGGAGQHWGLGAGSVLVTAGRAVPWPLVRSRWPSGTVPGSYPPPPHPQPAPAPGLSYLHLLCRAALSTPRVTGGRVGGTGAPGAPSLGLTLLAEHGPVSREAGGGCGLRGLPFQPQSACNWIHQHRQQDWSRGAPALPAPPPPTPCSTARSPASRPGPAPTPTRPPLTTGKPSGFRLGAACSSALSSDVTSSRNPARTPTSSEPRGPHRTVARALCVSLC